MSDRRWRDGWEMESGEVGERQGVERWVGEKGLRSGWERERDGGRGWVGERKGG